MNQHLKVRLVKIPYIGIALFFLLNIIAISQFPGYDKCLYDIENFSIEECKSTAYSFSYNFLSELGSLNTNTDDDKDPINEGGKNNVSNTSSMIFFNTSLVVVGLIIIIFYNSFNKLFIYKKDSSNSIKYSGITKYLGPMTGIMFAGVGIVPHDLHFTAHVIFANGAFLFLLFLSIFHTLTFKHSKFINSIYSYGYILFSILLFIYVIIIFFGPQIGPGYAFSRNDLVLQVVAQKLIVIAFIGAMFHQTRGISKCFN